MCRHCQDFKIQCYYADGKRDRVKKQFGSMAEKVADYEKLLKDLVTRIGGEDAELIKAMLDKEGGPETDGSVTREPTSTVDGETGSVNSADESDASAGAGSTGALDRTEEDFTRSEAKHTGFMGKNSELTWMQRLRQENKYGSPPRESADPEVRRREESATRQGKSHSSSAPPPPHEDGFTIQDSSYFLDDLPVSTHETVDAYEMPTREMANHLFDAYVKRVHPSFPIISKNVLSLQYNKFVIGQLQRPPDKWLAILNTIFAIGARYSHLIQAEWQADDRDHTIYFTRARILSMNGDSIFEPPDLQAIQVAGLMSFYMLCISQVNRYVSFSPILATLLTMLRAWTLAGVAIRGAVALGMYMRSDSDHLQDSYKEIRYRVWWSLYTLEHRLCNMTGRINSIVEDHVTTPLPLPYDEDDFESTGASELLTREKQQGERNPASSRSSSILSSTPVTERSNSLSKPDFSRTPSSQQAELEWAKNVPQSDSLYFLHLVQLTRLTQGIFHKLYTPAAITGSWKHIQKVIKELQQHLDDWYKALPVLFDFKRKQRDRESYEHRLGLGFFYYGTCITINRPTLCRLDRKMPAQSKESNEFNSGAAARCLQAAMDMLTLIPDEPNAVGLNRVGPFFSILHWLMQACTVLMLELSFRAYHMPQEAEHILEAAIKAVKWIHSLGEEDSSARRAWIFCNAMLRQAAKKIGREIYDLPEQPPGRQPSTSSQGRSEGSRVSYQPQQGQQQHYASFDRLMQHDQYFPDDSNMRNQSQYGQPSSAEMEFMNYAYLDGQDHQQLDGDGTRYN